MKKTVPNIEEQLRAAIIASELSVNAIATQSGVPQSTLSRFVAGETTIQMNSAAKVAEFFGMRLTKPKAKK